MSMPPVRTLLINPKAVSIFFASLLILILAGFLMRGPDSSDSSARIVSIEPDYTALRRDSIAWKSSAETFRRNAPPVQPVATEAMAFPPMVSSPFPDSTPPAADTRAPEVPSRTAVRQSVPHDPAAISVPTWAPPSMREGTAAEWQATGSISATQAIAYRQRIAQGEKIFKRAPDRTPGVLDSARGRKTVDSDARRTLPAYGGVR